MTDASVPKESPSFFSPIKAISLTLVVLFILGFLVAIFWSVEPELFDVRSEAAQRKTADGQQLVIGYTTVETTAKVAEALLNKPGGYLSNDILPPSVFMDNMPSWEYGALIQVRDMVGALRDHMSRSQSQSIENEHLKKADPLMRNDHTSWFAPEAESSYKESIVLLRAYRDALLDQENPNVQFYSRADNLRSWLEFVEKRLGALSQKLSASVGQARVNTDLAGDANATQSTHVDSQLMVQTDWLEIDDHFYEARGACWALIHLLKAVEVDFAQVLEKKNATVSLRQIIRELEATQEPVWSPMVLNGSGFGFLANHSLVMASYISRANAAVIDIRRLLEQG
ncbi:DUF2333 family protein [Pleionea sp. CnH1-48]|uniref:DUF2333 family protein n=1 Tax=Pleionea sp. CnH1-48 TaxID=2954494 RepID=UPI0020970FA1|nr:DUF2333 family protein [Pleionea sp. CnH1-48]MCO7226434.1 DUF2333 family protein [Pleionea sp. CnH1-48]